MAVSLVKGGNVSLTKEAPTMNVAMVGLGWDARVTDGQGFDLDASVKRAKDYISGALAAMLDLGKGSGPMNHAFDIQSEFTKENSEAEQ